MNQIATDEERLFALKQWWQKNSNWLLVAVVIIVVGFMGFRFYASQQLKQAEQASALFTEFFGAHEVGGAEAAQALAEQLQSEYSKTPYANAVALILARDAVEADDLDTASMHLTWVIDQGSDFAADIARARLAQIYLAQGQADAALQTLEQISPQGYQPLYDEIKGDALLMLQRPEDAQQYYQQAIMGYALLGLETHLLQFKIDNLNVETINVESEAATS